MEGDNMHLQNIKKIATMKIPKTVSFLTTYHSKEKAQLSSQ
jgi:hypothetical protein